MGQLDDGGSAVRPDAMDMQISPNILRLDEPGQPPSQRRLDLSPVLSQLRRYVLQAQGLVNLFLLIEEQILAIGQAGEGVLAQ